MLVHPAMLAHPNPRAVCVVGGGDGGTVREVLKHSTVERVVLAEIDEDVITVSKQFLPSISKALDDSRVELAIGDGAQYLKDHPGEFDVILSDSTDPVGPGVVLFEDPYFVAAKKALRGDGLFTTQCESLWIHADTARDVVKRLGRQFGTVLPYVSSIPTYPTGTWGFVIASDKIDPRTSFDAARQQEIAKTTRYYTPAHQSGAFAVPAFFYKD
jgi:spermidine synthase